MSDCRHCEWTNGFASFQDGSRTMAWDAHMRSAHPAPPPVRCRACQRTLSVGEQAWASDVKVIEPGGVRVEVRYTCDDCEVGS